MTLTFDHCFSDYQTLPSFFHSTPSCQSSYKSVNNFLSNRGNSLKIVIFNGSLTPVTFTCDLQLRPFFLTIEFSLPFFITHNSAKALLLKSLKTVIFNGYLTPVTLTCDLDFLPIFLTIQLNFRFIILYHPAKTHQNWLRTVWVIEVTA